MCVRAEWRVRDDLCATCPTEQNANVESAVKHGSRANCRHREEDGRSTSPKGVLGFSEKTITDNNQSTCRQDSRSELLRYEIAD